MKLYKAKGSASAVPAPGLSLRLASLLCSEKVSFGVCLAACRCAPRHPRRRGGVYSPRRGHFNSPSSLQRTVLIFCCKETDFSSKCLWRQTWLWMGLCEHPGNTECLSSSQIAFVQFTSHNKFMFYCKLFKANPTDWSCFIPWLV